MTQIPVQQLPPRAAPAPVGFTQVGAIAQAPSLHGAQVLAATLQPPPLLGYYWSMLGDTARKRVLEAIADYSADLFDKMLTSAMDALGLLKQGPRERLKFYRTVKTPQMWFEQQAKFPKDYAEDEADYTRLIEQEQAGALT